MYDMRELIKRTVRRKIRMASKDFPNYFNKEDRGIMRDIYLETRKDRSSVPKEPTFWTTFTFESTAPQDLHCTHKFFGTLEDRDVRSIMNTIENYFKLNPFKKFYVVFDVEEFFGENNETRVLTPKSYEEKNFLLDLRKDLDNFKADSYPTYRPHVTTPTLNKVAIPITGYSFLYGSTVLKKYEDS